MHLDIYDLYRADIDPLGAIATYYHIVGIKGDVFKIIARTKGVGTKNLLIKRELLVKKIEEGAIKHVGIYAPQSFTQ